MRKLVSILLVCVFLTACASPATETQSPVPTPAAPTQAQPTAVPPTAAPTNTAVPPSPVPASPTPAPTAVPPTEAPAGNQAAAIVMIASSQPVTIESISMLDASQGWAIGLGPDDLNDHILFTTNGGLAWRDVTPPEPAGTADAGPRKAVAYFMDATHAWVTYSGGFMLDAAPFVWRTQDGGQTWSASQTFVLGGDNGYGASDLFFMNAQSGWLLVHVGAGMMHDYITLLHTDDSGQTWRTFVDPQADAPSMSCSKTGLAIGPDGLGVWLAGDCGGVAPGAPYFQVSADGGQTWAELALPDPAASPRLYATDTWACGTFAPDLSASPVGRLVVSCRDYSQSTPAAAAFVYFTRDAGQNWQTAPLTGAFASAYFRGQSGWVQTGDVAPYKVWRTSDGGLTFSAGRDLSWKGQFSFVDDQTGWAVARGDDGSLALVKTSDGGGKWQIIQPLSAQ